MKCAKWKVVLAFVISNSVSVSAHAGIPVIDGVAIGKQVAEFVETLARYKQLIIDTKARFDQLKTQITAMTGPKGMQNLVSNVSRQTDVLPPSSTLLSNYNSIRNSGAAGASANARNIYANISVYGCNQQHPSDWEAQRSCEAAALLAPQNLDLINKSIDSAQTRTTQLKTLINQIDGAPDTKAAVDLQNRINAEVALSANDKILADMTLAAQQNQEKLNTTRQREIALKRLANADGSAKNPFGS